jgi:rhamnose transport system ATP-binding protein
VLTPSEAAEPDDMSSPDVETRAKPLVEIRAVRKSFGPVRALRDVSLTIHPGEAVGLIGENGAGKSTLSAILSGLLTPDSGELLIAGKPTRFAKPADAYAVGIRMAPQELVLCGELSVAENILLGHLPHRIGGYVDRAAMRTEARRRLSVLGLELDVDKPVGRLAVVDQAFVQIARTVGAGATLLIADEPTAPMSTTEVDRFLDLLNGVRRQGVAVLYVSHRFDEIFRLTSRVLVLRDGCVVAEHQSASTTHEQLVDDMVGGRDLVQRNRHPAGDRSEILTVRDLRCAELDGIGFSACAGELLAIYGTAGSGRSALGPALFGARRATGTIQVGGRPVRLRNPRHAIAQGIGYVPAERGSLGLLRDLSVEVNLTLASIAAFTRLGVFRHRRARRTAIDWMTRLAVAAPSPETPVNRLSGGTQQKVLLARWLAVQPRVLVLDEPTRGVDIATKLEIYRLLADLVAEGMCVIVVSSDVEEVAALGERVLVIRGGRIVRELDQPSERDIIRHSIGKHRPGRAGVPL